jgi:hypothetical protein
MKCSLTDYLSNITLISENTIFTHEDCCKIIKELDKNKDKWEPRKIGEEFLTCGTVAYLDTYEVAQIESYSILGINDDYVKNNYQNKARLINPFLWKSFQWVYKKIQNYYQERLNKPLVYWYKYDDPFIKALPAFHIFQYPELINKGKWEPPIHFDHPHLEVSWPEKLIQTFTFTIALQLPKCTSGLRYWENEDIFIPILTPTHTKYFHEMIESEKEILRREAKYLPYSEGCIYEHHGNMYHQIAEGGDFVDDERRITLQGHLAETEKEIIIYV